MSPIPGHATAVGAVTFAVVDVETTGLSPAWGHRVCEIAVLRCRAGQVLEAYDSLVNPGRPISPGASAVNGLVDADVAGRPAFPDIAPDVRARLDGAVVVAHNAPFDLGFLAAEWRRLGWPAPEVVAVDTLALARRLYRLSRYALGDVAQALRVPVDREHRALADARTTLGVLGRIVDDLGRRRALTLGDLLAAQDGGVAWPAAEPAALPPILESALAEGRRVWIRYQGPGQRVTERWVEPVDVTDDGQALSLVAHCLLRGDERTFRVDRILDMRLDEGPEPTAPRPTP